MGQRVGVRLVDHGGDGAFGEGGRDIIMAVIIGAADGDEEIARLKRARIDRNAGGVAFRHAAADPRIERRDKPEAGPENIRAAQTRVIRNARFAAGDLAHSALSFSAASLKAPAAHSISENGRMASPMYAPFHGLCRR